MRNPEKQETMTIDHEQDRVDPSAGDGQEGLLDLVLTETVQQSKVDGVVVGKLTGFDDSGMPLVTFVCGMSAEAVPARATVVLAEGAIGCEVALLFEHGDASKPIVIGLMWTPEHAEATLAMRSLQVQADDERLTLTAEREIVLRCGKASITLTRAGKILLRGTYLLSRSSGVNRIKGGSVQIN